MSNTQNNMNNKGYTLIELLAAIILLTLIAGIATNRVMSAIEKSKEKSEKIFIDKLETTIEEYLSLKGSTINSNSTEEKNIIKCRVDFEELEENNTECPEEYQIESKLYTLTTINLKDIIENNKYKTLKKEDIINPKNKKNCLDNGVNPKIRLFKDSDYVYYYYMDLSNENTSCNISDENAIVTNLSKNICNTIKENAYDNEKGICKLDEE